MDDWCKALAETVKRHEQAKSHMENDMSIDMLGVNSASATGQRSADNKEVDKNRHVFREHIAEEIRTADFVSVATLLHKEDNRRWAELAMWKDEIATGWREISF